GDVGDPAGFEAHEPLDEGGAQSIAIVSCPGSGASSCGLPAADGGGETAPIKVGLPRPNVALCRSPSDAVGVGSSSPLNTRSPSVVPAWCLLSGFERPEVAFLVPRESATVGVGSSETVVRKSSPPSPC